MSREMLKEDGFYVPETVLLNQAQRISNVNGDRDGSITIGATLIPRVNKEDEPIIRVQRLGNSEDQDFFRELIKEHDNPAIDYFFAIVATCEWEEYLRRKRLVSKAVHEEFPMVNYGA